MPVFRHAHHLEREYRGRLLRRVRALATQHSEANRKDDAPTIAPVLGLIATAKQVGRFVGKQVRAMIAAAIGKGAPFVLPQRRTLPVLEEGVAPIVVDPPPSVAEQVLFATWAERERVAIEANEARLLAEIGTRPDALERAEKGARNIAREGVGWLTGRTVEALQRGAGVQAYVWRGMLDEKERETHVALEGTAQRWDDPPISEVAGERFHPGQAWNCRCFADVLWDPTWDPTAS